MGCLYGTPDSCSSVATAYYKFAGIEQVITQKQQLFMGHYPLLTSAIATAASAYQGIVIIGLGHGRSLTIDKEAKLGFKAAF